MSIASSGAGNPANSQVQALTKYRIAINFKTAKALCLAPIGRQKFSLSLNGLQHGSAAQNRYYTLHVVGEHIQCHLGCDLVSSSHQEVRRTQAFMVPNGCSAV